jgi:hypothetical protein
MFSPNLPNTNQAGVPLYIEACYGIQLNFLFYSQVTGGYQDLSRRYCISYLQSLRVHINKTHFLRKNILKNAPTNTKLSEAVSM